MKVAIGNDHAGYHLKIRTMKWLEEQGFEVVNYGTDSSDSVDYSDFAHQVAQVVEDQEYDMGVLICGTGQGVAITANKHPGIRASLCWNPEIAQLARLHNNSNILCLPGGFMDKEKIFKILDNFFHTGFEGGRHQRRLSKIPIIS